MKVQVNDAANSQKELIFELPYETFEKASETELTKIMPEVKVPGFRPGKAPKDVVKKQYSHKIKAQAIEKVINDALKEGMTANNINPLSQPSVSDVKFEDNEPISFKARIDVFPTLKLEKYSGFETEKAEIKISDKDIDATLASLQEQHVSFEPVKGRKSAKNDDMTIINFLGKIDDVAFPGGSAENFSLRLGSGQFIPGFEDGVVDMKIGETKDINVIFPEDYNQKDLAGKPAIFTVTLNEIKEKVSPKLDDDFAKDINDKFETLEQLKENIRKGIQAEYDNGAKFDAFNDLLNMILKENPFDVPFVFVKEQSERLAYNSMQQFYQMGLNPEQVGINFEMMVQRHIPQAQVQVKQALIINEIAKKENIIVEDADVDKFVAFHAELQNRTVEELKKDLDKNHQLEAIRNDVLGDKVYDFLSTINEIKVKKMTKEEYEKEKKTKAEAAAASPVAKKSSKTQKDVDDKPEKSDKTAQKKETTEDKDESSVEKKKPLKKTAPKGDK